MDTLYMFNGLPPVQVFRRLILKVQYRLKLKILIIIGFRLAEANLQVRIWFGFKNLKPSIRLVFWYTAGGAFF